MIIGGLTFFLCAEKLRNQVVSMQAEHRSPSSDQDGAAAVETTLSWIPYSNPAHTRSMPPGAPTMPPRRDCCCCCAASADLELLFCPCGPAMAKVIGTLFPPMSEASVPFVVDNDDKPLCLIKRQVAAALLLASSFPC